MNLLNACPQSFQHGDFHAGNMILTSDKKLGLIDFTYSGFGDPFEDFVKNYWFSREQNVDFLQGTLDGYFEDKLPEQFFSRLKLYLAREIFVSIPWAQHISTEKVSEMLHLSEIIQQDFDNFTQEIPCWYKKIDTKRKR